MHTKITILHLLFSLAVFSLVAGRAWRLLRRRGSWLGLLGWCAVAILIYWGFVVWVSGPGALVLAHLPPGVFFGITLSFGTLVIVGLFEVAFRALDGPFPKLPGGASPVNVSRRRLYPWMGAAAIAVIVLAVAAHFGPKAWQENLSIATMLAGISSCFTLWYLHYIARRFDYGRSAVQAHPWFHWVYTADDLKGFKGVKSGPDSETWIGPDGLSFNGDFGPWDLLTYELVRAVLNNDPPPTLDFTFKKTSFGNATSLETFHIPIPAGHDADIEVIQQNLRALCPKAEINLLSSGQ